MRYKLQMTKIWFMVCWDQYDVKSFTPIARKMYELSTEISRHPRKACSQEACRAWHTAWLLAPPCILSHRLGPPSRSHQPTAWGRCSPRHGLAPCWGGEPRWLRGNDVWHQLAARCVQRRRCFTWCWLFAQVLGSTADSCCVAATLNPTELCPACALRCRRRCSFLSAREIGEEKGKLGNLTICHF